MKSHKSIAREALMAGGGLLAALAVAGAAQAGATLTPIPSYAGPPGAVTNVFGVNDSGAMAGTVTYSDGSSDGFLRDAGGTYHLFNEGPDTIGRAIDESNNVTGYVTDATQNLLTDNEFFRTPGGVTTLLQNPLDSSFLHGIAQGMNSLGPIVGDFYHQVGVQLFRHGYVLDGSSFTELSVPGDPNAHMQARGITKSGEVAGFATVGGVIEGFLYQGGTYTFFNDPNAVQGTFFEDINNHGIVSGEWNDVAGNSHAFQFNSNTDVFTEILVAGATNTQSFGLDNHGRQVITTDLPTGPNNFLYTPTPEPAAWAMMLLGVFGAGALLRRRREAARTA
jgi:hypothetical protein